MQERRALGKGLSSLIPFTQNTQKRNAENSFQGQSENGENSGNSGKNEKFFECKIEDLVANQNQPRKLFDKAAIDELASSIEEKGIIQPLLVRKLGGGKFEIVAGERRFRASQSLGLKTVPVILKDDLDDRETLEIALIENIQRQDLNPIEEGLAYKELINKYQYTQEQLAKRLGKDRSSVANSLRLLKLPEGVRTAVIEGKISMGHARALLAIDDSAMQQKIAQKIVEDGLSVREIENLVREMVTPIPLRPVATRDVNNEPTIEKSPAGQSFRDLEESLKRHLKTMVQIRAKGKSSLNDKGKIIVHFESSDELAHLSDILMR